MSTPGAPALSHTVLTPIAGEKPAAAAHARGWRWARRVAVLMAIAAIGIGLRLTYFRPAAVPVTVSRVQLGRVEELVANNKAGTVNARRRASLSPEIGGVIALLPVQEGDYVKKGWTLLALSDVDLRAQVTLQERALDTARSTVTEACAASDLASRNLERTRRLADERLVSQQGFDQAESQSKTAAAGCASARARLGQAEAGVDLARVTLAKSVLRAPFDGVVSKVSAEVGEWVSPSPGGARGVAPVIEIIDTRSVYVRAPLDEVDAGKLRIGLPVRITMDAYPGRSFPGRVTYIGSYVSEAQQQNRTFDVDVEFDDTAFARTLLPGTSADIEIVLRARENVARIPTSAILQGGRVLVVRGATLVSVPIRTGLSNWEVSEVVDGLRPGDPVVVSLDRLEVREGARITVVPEASP